MVSHSYSPSFIYSHSYSHSHSHSLTFTPYSYSHSYPHTLFLPQSGYPPRHENIKRPGALLCGRARASEFVSASAKHHTKSYQFGQTLVERLMATSFAPRVVSSTRRPTGTRACSGAQKRCAARRYCLQFRSPGESAFLQRAHGTLDRHCCNQRETRFPFVCEREADVCTTNAECDGCCPMIRVCLKQQ